MSFFLIASHNFLKNILMMIKLDTLFIDLQRLLYMIAF